MQYASHPVSRENGRGAWKPGRCVTATGDEATGERRRQWSHGRRSDHKNWRQLLAMLVVCVKSQASNSMYVRWACIYSRPVDGVCCRCRRKRVIVQEKGELIGALLPPNSLICMCSYHSLVGAFKS